MSSIQRDVWVCRVVAVLVLTLFTVLESLFILMLLAPVDPLTSGGLVIFLRILVITIPFNAAVFLFSTHYQIVKGRCSGVCNGVCSGKFDDQLK